MSLAKIAQEGTASRRGCPFGKWAASLSTEEAAGLDKMLSERTATGGFVWSAKAAAEDISKDADYPGVEFGHQAVYRHRMGWCSCARPPLVDGASDAR